MIREGARRAAQRAQEEDFGIIPLNPPFRRVVKLRRSERRPSATFMEVEHPTSFIAVMNMWGEEKPLDG